MYFKIIIAAVYGLPYTYVSVSYERCTKRDLGLPNKCVRYKSLSLYLYSLCCWVYKINIFYPTPARMQIWIDSLFEIFIGSASWEDVEICVIESMRRTAACISVLIDNGNKAHKGLCFMLSARILEKEHNILEHFIYTFIAYMRVICSLKKHIMLKCFHVCRAFTFFFYTHAYMFFALSSFKCAQYIQNKNERARRVYAEIQ